MNKFILLMLMFLYSCIQNVNVDEICPNQKICPVYIRDDSSHFIYIRGNDSYFFLKENHSTIIKYAINYLDSLNSYPESIKINFIKNTKGIPATYDEDFVEDRVISNNTYAQVIGKNFPEKLELIINPYNDQDKKKFNYIIQYNESTNEYIIKLD